MEVDSKTIDYFDCDQQIELHRNLIEQMKADGKMCHNVVQNYWTPKPEHLDDYNRIIGVISLLRNHKDALRILEMG